MQPLPIGIQTFKDLREGKFLYVDKTEQIYSLIKNSKGAYFLPDRDVLERVLHSLY